MELRGAPLIPPENAPASLRAAPAAQTGAEEDQRIAVMRRAAEQFEAMFLSEMMAPMFENLDTEGLGGGGAGEKMFRPMLVEQYANAIAKSGGVGIADSLVRELTRMQMEGPDGAPR